MKRIKTNDTVVMTAGKDRGKTGKVIRVLSKDKRVVVEGLNMRTKHVRPRRQGEKGQRVQVPGSIHLSNVKVVCERCGRGVRVGFGLDAQGNKQRICRHCEEAL